MISLLITAALFCGQFDQQLAIAIAINAQQPQQQSVVVEPEPAAVKYTTRQETRYRWVRQRYNCRGGQCSYRMVKQAYTVTVPVEASAAKANWPSYPTTPRQRAWTQGGRHVTWRHLLEGEHKAWKFDPAWLASLSQIEVEQLHADCHEGKVRTNFIVRKEP